MCDSMPIRVDKKLYHRLLIFIYIMFLISTILDIIAIILLSIFSLET